MPLFLKSSTVLTATDQIQARNSGLLKTRSITTIYRPRSEYMNVGRNTIDPFLCGVEDGIFIRSYFWQRHQQQPCMLIRKQRLSFYCCEIYVEVRRSSEAMVYYHLQTRTTELTYRFVFRKKKFLTINVCPRPVGNVTLNPNLYVVFFAVVFQCTQYFEVFLFEKRLLLLCCICLPSFLFSIIKHSRWQSNKSATNRPMITDGGKVVANNFYNINNITTGPVRLPHYGAELVGNNQSSLKGKQPRIAYKVTDQSKTWATVSWPADTNETNSTFRNIYQRQQPTRHRSRQRTFELIPCFFLWNIRRIIIIHRRTSSR